MSRNKGKRQHGAGVARPAVLAVNVQAPIITKPTGTRVRYVINGELEALTALHVGTGEARVFTALQTDSTDRPEVARLVRDHRSRPYLPGTTVKGLLRRVAEGLLARDAADALLGTIKAAGGGTMGSLLVRGAAESRSGDARGMPYSERLAEELGPGIFIAARTSIDRHEGTAAHNRLFFQEMVAPGARYRLSLLLEARARRTTRDSLDDAIAVLVELTGAAGWAIGKGQSEGQGRVRLDPKSVTIDEIVLDRNATLKSQSTQRWNANAAPRSALTAVPEEELILGCPGPFFIVDSSHVPQRGPDGEPTGPQVLAQRSGGGPLILGSSLLGVLRSRAAWLEALRFHREGDDRNADTIDDPDRAFASAATLTSIERLFGVTGFRGLIELRALEVLAGKTASFTSVKLDRFSGAPIDNGLFTTDAFVDTKLRVRLALTKRGDWPSEDDKSLFGRLIGDICANGIVLGHRGNAGFGWFTVEREVSHAA